MEELTESARQNLVSQGIIMGVFSAFNSFGLLLIGIVVVTRAKDILHFTTLSHLAFLQIGCGVSAFVVVAYIWWIVAAYRNRQMEIRAKYLDESITKGLAALILPLITTISAFVVSAIFLMIKLETSSTYDLKSAMTLYSSDVTRKVIVDKLQMIFECCGSQSLLDWFLIDWQNSDLEPIPGFENITFIDWDSVPFSCCCPESPPPCIHHQLKTFGVGSIFLEGCSDKLDQAILAYLILCLIMFFISIILMVMLLYTARKLQTSARSAIMKGDSTAPGTWWLLSPTTSKITHLCDTMPLLEKTKNIGFKANESLTDCWVQSNQIVVTPTLFSKKSKIIDSTAQGDWETGSKADGYESEDWTRMACEASGYTSSTSFMSESRPTRTSTDCYFSWPLPSATSHLNWLLRRVKKLERLIRFDEDIPDVSPFTTAKAIVSGQTQPVFFDAFSCCERQNIWDVFIELESRQSRSDTAVAHLEVSRHQEHKVRPLFRT